LSCEVACSHLWGDERTENRQVDHIATFASDGPTTQENGHLISGFMASCARLRAGGRSNQEPPPRSHSA